MKIPPEIKRQIEVYGTEYAEENSFERREQMQISEAWRMGASFMYFEMRLRIEELEKSLFQARMEQHFPNVEHDRALRGKFKQ